MKIKFVAAVSAVGLLLGTVLRFLNFWLLYDGDKGFLGDNGIMSFAGLAIMGLAFLAVLLVSVRNKDYYAKYRPSPGMVRGIFSIISALIALWSSLRMWQEYMELKRQMQAMAGTAQQEVSATGLSVRFPFIVVTVGLGIYLLVQGLIHLINKEDLLAKWKVLELVPVIWGLFFILYVFIHYSVSFLVSENAFVIFSACALSYGLLSRAKFVSGAEDDGRGLLRLGLSSSLACMLCVSYGLSNAALRLMGHGFGGDLPIEVQALISIMAISLMVSLLSSKWEKAEAPVKEDKGGTRFR